MTAGVLRLAALALVGCTSKLPTARIVVGEHPLTVEIAADPETRAEGLMHRDHLGADRGMLFVYPRVDTREFWMKNTRIPLSIAYIESGGRIERIADMQPLTTDRVPSLYPVKYALEVNRGWFEAHGVGPGVVVRDLPQVDAK